jgi:hypothetical protein
MYWEVLPRKVMARIEQERSEGASPGRFAGLLSLSRLRWFGAMAAAVIAVWVGLEVWTFRQADAPAAPSVSEMEDRAVATRPALRREIEEPDQQPVPSSLPADSEADADAELRQLGPAAPEPSFEEEPAVPRQDRPATPVGGRDQPAAGLAGGEVEEVESLEPSLSFQRAPVVAPGERQEQEVSDVSKTQAEAVSLDEVAMGASVGKQTAAGGVASPSPVPPSPTKESFLTPGEPSRKRQRATLQTLSTQTTSEADLRSECRAIRTFLSQDPSTEQAIDARYRLALCSIRLFRSYPTEESRRQADEDCTAFLEVSSEDERVDEVRRELEAIKN